MTKQEFPFTFRSICAFAKPVLVMKPTSLRDRFMDLMVVLLVKMMLFMVIVMLAMQGEVMVVLMVFVLVEICLQGGVFDKSENSSCLCCTHLFEKKRAGDVGAGVGYFATFEICIQKGVFDKADDGGDGGASGVGVSGG